MSRTEDEAEVDEREDEDDEPTAPGDPLVAYFDRIDDRVEDLCDTVLAPRLAALEGDRLRVRNAIKRGLIVAGAPLALLFLSDLVAAILETVGGQLPVVRFAVDHLTLLLVALFILAIAFVVTRQVMPGIAAQLNYRRRFKQEVVHDVFRLLRPDDTYQPDAHVSADVVDRSGLWTAPFGAFSGDDLMRGRAGSIEFEASEIKLHSRVTVSTKKKNESSRRSNVTAFHGAFLHFALPHTLKGHTIVEPEDAAGRLPWHRKGFEQVDVGDETFGERYRVYATDAAEARTILTPRVRERLLILADHLSDELFLSFVGDRAFVAVQMGASLLEPTIAQRVSYGTLARIAEFFALPEALVNEVGIVSSSPTFATGARTSIRSQPAAASPFAATAGPLQASDLLEAGMEQADDRDLARRPPPESRVRVSPLTSEGLTVTYGMTPSLYFRVLCLLALAPFLAGGIAAIVGEPGRSVLDTLSVQIPWVVDVAGFAAAFPWIFAALASFFYLLPAWGLVFMPRAVHIERAGVRISKRVWPVAKVYAIDRISSVRVTERQVIFVRKNASLLRRLVLAAPPMQTADDARWLAAHLRRAIVFFGGLR